MATPIYLRHTPQAVPLSPLFVGNPRGGRTASILASLTSTCRRHDVDPQLYLTQLLVNLPSAPISELSAWLPDQWKLRQSKRTLTP